MRPIDVLGMHGDLLDRFRDDRWRAVIHNLFMLDLNYLPGTEEDEQRLIENADYLTETLQRNVAGAHTYRVTEDMCDLVIHAASLLDNMDRFDASLAPTGVGLCRFDKPLPLDDIRGRTMKVHWCTWGPAMAQDPSRNEAYPVTMCTFWNDAADPDDVGDAAVEQGLDGEMVQQVLGRWRWCGATYAPNGLRLGPPRLIVDPALAAMIREEGDDPAATYGNSLRYVHALWLLLNQSITAVAAEGPDRHGRRRAERMKVPTQITVIHLRRSVYTDHPHEESDVEWSHRWLTRGHWRWQHVSHHYPGAVEIAPGDWRARIWISEFIKGPEDKPLIITQKINSLER